MERRTTLFSFLVMLLAVPGGRALGQNAMPPAPAVDSASTPPPSGPRVELARVGIAHPAPAVAHVRTSADGPAPPVVQGSRESGRTMMLVGGVAFLGGLLIGDNAGTAIAIGGLAVGVWGFYQLIR